MTTDTTTSVLLALGSNTHAAENMERAAEALRLLLPSIRFSPTVSTAPIGMGGDNFLNALAEARIATTSPYTAYDTLHTALKAIEHRLGSTAADRREGRVAIDIDILRIGSHRYHEEDWERGYIRALVRSEGWHEGNPAT